MKTFFQLYEEVRVCELCKKSPKSGSLRYCKPCSKVVLQDMKDKGYLTKTQRMGSKYRGPESAEDTHATKHGSWHG